MKGAGPALFLALELATASLPAYAQTPATTSRIGILGGHHGWAYFLFRPLGLRYHVEGKHFPLTSIP